jgi:hypothetical protein
VDQNEIRLFFQPSAQNLRGGIKMDKKKISKERKQSSPKLLKFRNDADVKEYDPMKVLLEALLHNALLHAWPLSMAEVPQLL